MKVVWMINLGGIIKDLLSEDTDIRLRGLRLFQFIYWLTTGGQDQARFKDSMAIYASCLLGYYSRTNARSNLQRDEAALLAVSDKLFADILREANDNYLFFRLTAIDNRILTRSGRQQICVVLDRINTFNRSLLQLRTQVDQNASFNDASKLVGGRTKMTEHRACYSRQSGFIYACFSSDYNLIDLSDASGRRLTPVGLMKALRDRNQSDRVKRVLKLAKSAVAVLDKELNRELAEFWPDLETTDLQLPPLSPQQRESATARPRRSAEERRSTTRQMPRVR